MADFLVQERDLEELVIENSEKEEKKETKEDTKIDEVEELIEQELNQREIVEFLPLSNPEFEQNIKYEGGFLDFGSEIKNYHYEDTISKIVITPRGDSYDNMIISYETEVLAEGQQIIADAKNAEMTGGASLVIGMQKETKESIKLFYPATWQFMYSASGLTFN